MRKRQKSWARDMARQRIDRLFDLARDEFPAHPERSDRYVGLARKISMKYRLRMPQGLKQKICKYCYAYLVPGATARIRLQGTHMTTTCLSCGNQMRRPYVRHPVR